MTSKTPKAHDFSAQLTPQRKTPDDMNLSIPESIKKSVPKNIKDRDLENAEASAKQHGFTDRSGNKPKNGRQRKKSPYTMQLNIRVKPETRSYIIAEAAKSGVVLGKLLDDALDLYRASKQ